MNQIEAKKQKIEFLSYIIGLLSFILLGSLIDNMSVTYMAVIIECISLFVLLINGSSADVIGKMLRTRRKKSQYKEAHELHKSIMLIQCVFSVVLMAVYFFLTDALAAVVFKMPFLAVAMKILTPVILLKAWQCSMLGYFQGQGSHMPTVVCSVFRQLLFLLFGLILTGRLYAYGEKVAALLNNSNLAGMYGAVALCLAILISEILISLFLLIVYIGSDRKKEKQKTEDGLQTVESFKDRVRLAILISLPEAGKEILKKLPFALAVFLILLKTDDWVDAADTYGSFYRLFICVCAMIVFLISSRLVNVYVRLSAFLKKKDMRTVREIICSGMHYCWIAGLFVSVSLAVLSPLIARILNDQSAGLIENYFLYGAPVIAVVLMNMFLWTVLYIMGAKKMNYIALVLMNAGFLISFLLLSGKVDGILVLCIAALIGCGIQMIASFVYIARKYVLQPDVIRCFVIPVVGAAIMGLIAMLVQNLLSPHLGSIMCLILCLIISIIVYLAVLILTRSIKESEVNSLYGSLGRRILGLLIR